MICQCGHPFEAHTDWYVEEITGDAGYACRECRCVEATDWRCPRCGLDRQAHAYACTHIDGEGHG